MFAIAVIPVLGLVGAAVDYSRANSVRAGLQSALDATSLAMAKLAPTLTQSELQQKTTAYFNAMFNHPEAKNLVITPAYSTSGGSQLTITASGTMDTTFMRVMGFNSLNIGSNVTVKWGNNRLRVALALDNTGSMDSDGKIGALKTATNNLLTQLKTAATNNGDVYVSIVPFSKNVNVGTSTYTNATWVDWEDWEDDNGHDQSTTTCSNQKSGKNGKSKKKCSTTTTWVPDNHNTWNGCITDRDKEYDVQGTAPTSTTATKFPAEQYDKCPVPVMGLSYDWNKHELARQHDEGRRHDQPDHRSRVGVDVADRRRPVHRPDEGRELQVSGHHCPDERRPQHREPLGRQRLVAIIGGRCPHEPRLHQCEERRADHLHGACEHRRRSDLAGAEELREQPEQLLHRDLVGSAQHRVQSDRLSAFAATHLEVTPLRQHGTNKKPGQSAGLLHFVQR